MLEELTTNALDRHFARLMVELHGAECPELETAARTVSAWRAAGHICVPLAAVSGENLAVKLRATRVVGAPGDFKPLILDGAGRLYLQRYWEYEDQLARAILARIEAAPPAVDAERLARGVDRYFQDQPGTEWQRRAAEVAVQNNFSVITGAPGTGKTHTVAIVLALLQEQFAARGFSAQIALAAPTGKAAARMNESIQTVLGRLSEGERLRAALPRGATTLHRLLGTIPGSSSFRHHAGRPLPFDVLIVDEASMVDLALMARLLAALPVSSRLILLGDKHQLASVEAGSVLADICAHAGEPNARGPLAER
ncbi:MAG: AAA family ATPase, partial [Verrucomicrobiota bacterium]|nr:AAA family ATPase [Verrucomicrobiota bacterium]